MDDNLEFILRGKGSDISIDFLEPIVIPIETYSNIPNIEEKRNNQLKIKVPGVSDYKIFSLDTGAYELKIIAEQLVEWIELTFPNLKNVEDSF